MGLSKACKTARFVMSAVLSLSPAVCALAQSPPHFDPTLQSLDQHSLPQWYDDAKLGSFIHWGLYSVPGWAPLTMVNLNSDFWKTNPYAEWYYNTVRIEGSPTQEYNQKTYGANHDYYSYADTFN